MKIEWLSTQYAVKRITHREIANVLRLCEGNPLYYRHCPPQVNREEIAADLRALPPGKTHKDKFYVGFYRGRQLVAVMDLISGYPDAETGFIGFFMVDCHLQGEGVGTTILSQCLLALQSMGFKRAQLGYVKGNQQAEHFWLKNHFTPTGEESVRERYTVVVMERTL